MTQDSGRGEPGPSTPEQPPPPDGLRPMVSLPFVLAPLDAETEVTTVIAPVRPTSPSSAPGAGRRRRLLLVIAGAVLVAALVAAAVLVGPRLLTPPPAPPAPPAPTVPTTSPTTGGPTPAPSGSGLPAGPVLDADQIVVPRVTAAGARLYLARPAGPTPPTLLPTPAAGRFFGPGLSADRRTILYVDGDAGTLRVMASDGSGDRALFRTPPRGCGRIRQASWSRRDIDLVVVQCRRSGGDDVLLVIHLDGRVVRTLATGSRRVEDPSVSPDGRTVVFWRGPDGGPDGGSLYTVPVDGSAAPTRLTDRPAGSDADPAWSPDGTTLAFRRRTPGRRGDVYLMKADGSLVRRLVGGPANEEKPAWSPDGTRLLVVSDRGKGGGVDLYRVDADGTGLKPLGLSAKDISTPVWSHR